MSLFGMKPQVFSASQRSVSPHSVFLLLTCLEWAIKAFRLSCYAAGNMYVFMVMTAYAEGVLPPDVEQGREKPEVNADHNSSHTDYRPNSSLHFSHSRVVEKCGKHSCQFHNNFEIQTFFSPTLLGLVFIRFADWQEDTDASFSLHYSYIRLDQEYLRTPA